MRRRPWLSKNQRERRDCYAAAMPWTEEPSVGRLIGSTKTRITEGSSKAAAAWNRIQLTLHRLGEDRILKNDTAMFMRSPVLVVESWPRAARRVAGWKRRDDYAPSSRIGL